jgi:peptide deformylase
MAACNMNFYDQSGYSARVPRALAVRVEAWDEAGEPFTLEASGWAARIVQVR